MERRTSILVPLYIYPVEGAWEPLYKAIEKHQSDRFIIIINPASGPGETKLPDTNWIREIIRLNKYKHVYCIGYIAVAYGKRPFDSVEGNIQKYARWADGGLMIQGIFVDEAPSMADEHNFRYIQDIEHAVWASSVLGTGKIILNPGTIADRRLIAHADQTVISEQRFETFVNRHLAKSFSELSDRDSLVCIMHSIPPDLPIEQLKPIVRQLKEVVGTLFLTDLSVNYYHSFSQRFAKFVDIIFGEA